MANLIIDNGGGVRLMPVPPVKIYQTTLEDGVILPAKMVRKNI